MNRRVLFCDSSRVWGGVEHWMVLTAGELRKRGWQVAIAGRTSGELLRRATTAGIPTVPWPFRWAADPVTLLQARRYLRRECPDLVVVALGKDIRLVGLAARRQGIPVLWRVGVPYPHLGWWHRVTGKLSVTRVITPSDYLRASLEKTAGLAGKIDVVPNGLVLPELPTAIRIAQARRQLSWSPDEFVILWAGRFKRQKGVDVLITAFAALPDPRRLRLVLAGTGPEGARLRQAAAQVPMGLSIEFVGYQSDLSRYLDACDLLVLPSRMETFGNVILEAMARGKPIVATRVGGIPATVGEDAALLVPPDDPVSLASAISRLREDTAAGELMGRAGRLRVEEHFTADRMTDGIEAVFLRVLGQESAKRA